MGLTCDSWGGWMTWGEGAGTVWEDCDAGREDLEDPDSGDDDEWAWDT